jgi:hypothetical protein
MRRPLLALVGVVVVVLGVGQLVLPGFAERRIRSRIEPYSTGVRVGVSAVPAVKLLWGHADKVTIAVDEYRSRQSSSGAPLGDLLARTAAIHDLDARVGLMTTHKVTLHDVVVHKAGERLTGRATVLDGELDEALPNGLKLRSRPDAEGRLLLSGRASAFGLSAGARARVLADDGALVIEPEGSALASLVKVKVFSDPRVAIDDMRARRYEGGFTVSARARVPG